MVEGVVGKEAGDGLAQGGEVGGGGEQAGAVVLDGFGDAADAGGDGGDASEGRFEQDDAEAFDVAGEIQSGEDEEVGLVEQGAELRVGDGAEQVDVVFQVKLGDLGLDAVAQAFGVDEGDLGVVADDLEEDVGVVFGQRGHDVFDEFEQALAADEAADGEEDAAGGGRHEGRGERRGTRAVSGWGCIWL